MKKWKWRLLSKALVITSVVALTVSTALAAVAPAQNASDKEWKFTYFGTSTSPEVNTIKEGSSIDTQVSMTSASYNEDGSIKQKGGKFVATDGYDGISYYYTTIDPKTENFSLKADVTIDYINPSPDGQEGFAIIARDTVGDDGVSDKPFYSNSMAAIGTKLDYVVDNKKINTVKDGLGYRFFTGLQSPDITPQRGSFKLEAGALDGKDKLQLGETYTMILQRSNTGYHIIYVNKNGERKEKIYYFDDKTDPLTVADNKIYVGFAVSRGCNATFKNIEFKVTDKVTDPPAQEHPYSYVNPVYKVISSDTSGTKQYNLTLQTNVDAVAVPVVNGKKLSQIKVKAGVDTSKLIPVSEGDNKIEIAFTPKENALVEAFTKLNSYETKLVNKTITVNSTYPKDLYVSPQGTVAGTGRESSPVDLATALKFAVPGQNIYLQPGTYNYDTLKVARGINGKKDAMITLQTVPNSNSKAVLDFRKKGTGFEVWGNYWHLKNIDITNTGDMHPGLQIAGNYNIVEQVNAYDNGNTGIQIGGMTSETIDKWPSYNLVLNCTSHDNADAAMEDADGFAAKITCGVGNVFDGCIASYNADDGWDFFAKVAAGNIGAVTIKNSVAYKNGYIHKDGEIINAGNGNGFKMGGSGLSGHHVLINSIAYENKGNGIDSNFCPDIEAYDSTSYNNEKANVAFYSNKDIVTGFKAKGLLSVKDKYMDKKDRFQLVGQDESIIYTADNYLFDGIKTANSLGESFNKDIFVNVDTSVEPTRNVDGSINMHGLLLLKNNDDVKNAGARFSKP